MSVRRYLARIVGIGFSSLLAVVVLVAFFAWLALQVRWQVPDPTALTAPTVIRAADGTVLTRFTSEVDRRAVPLSAVSRATIDAIVAAEDARFYEHDGVDPWALLRAIVTNVRTGSIDQGGSTLTQQYVKNAFTSGERTIARKVREAVISIQLERELTKEAILERYLNTVYFGEGAYGIEAAALTYFGVPAAQLSPAQGALLAQLLPAPSARNPRADPDGAEARADALLARMATLGVLSPQEAARAADEEVEVLPRRRRRTLHPYFVTYVRKQLTAVYGEERVLTGGLDVRTTLDLRVQKAIAEAVAEHLPPEAAPIEAGVVAVDPRSGAIIGAYSGRDFAVRQYDLALQALRQPGSTFKTFVYLAALEQEMSPRTRYPAPGRVCIDRWCPSNSGGRGYGRIDISSALVRSVNTVYAQLGEDVGAGATARMASRLGVRSRLSTEDVTISLGTYETTVLDLASAYGTIANDGIACPAHAIAEVIGPDGQPLPLPPERRVDPDVLDERPEGLARRDEGRCYGALDANIARTTTQTLEDVVSSRGTAARADIDRPQAGKTGTSQDNVDAWYAGYTPQLSLAVWVGHPEKREPLRDVAGVRTVFGGTIPALIWRDAAAAILEPMPVVDFPAPGELGRGQRRVPPAMSRDVSDPDEPTDAPSGDPATEEGGVEQPSPTEEPTDGPTEDGGDGGDTSGGSTGDDDDDGDSGGCIPLVTC